MIPSRVTTNRAVNRMHTFPLYTFQRFVAKLFNYAIRTRNIQPVIFIFLRQFIISSAANKNDAFSIHRRITKQKVLFLLHLNKKRIIDYLFYLDDRKLTSMRNHRDCF